MTKKAAIFALIIGMSMSGQSAAAHCCSGNNYSANGSSLTSSSASYKLNTESGVKVYRPNATISALNSRNNARAKSENNLRAAQAELALAQGREADAQSRSLNAQTRILNDTVSLSSASQNRSGTFNGFGSSAYYGTALSSRFGTSDITRFGGFGTLSNSDIIGFNTGIGALSDGAFAPRGAGVNDGLTVTQRVLQRQGSIADNARAAGAGASPISAPNVSAPSRSISRGFSGSSGGRAGSISRH